MLQRRRRPGPMVRKPTLLLLAWGLPASTPSAFVGADSAGRAEEVAAGAWPVDARSSPVISTTVS